MQVNESFIPVPNALAEALMSSKLSGGQCRLILWVLRNTLGWNRDSTRFTWYRIAKELGMNRSTTLRAARELIEFSVLLVKDAKLSMEPEPERWSNAVQGRNGASVHRKRCARAPIFRRPIDMFNVVKKKERNTTKKEKSPVYHAAGAARPIKGKYAQLSES